MEMPAGLAGILPFFFLTAGHAAPRVVAAGGFAAYAAQQLRSADVDIP